MANYDAIFVLAPGLSEEKVDSLLAKFEKKIKDNGGEITRTEKWGQKRLNYEFKRYKGVKEGFYILMTFTGEGKTVSVLRETLRLQEEVMRQIITCVKEEAPAAAEEAAVVFPEISQEQPSGQPQ
jgi:small subunit ribosomal protein S6